MIGLGHGFETGAGWTNRTKTCTKTLQTGLKSCVCVCINGLTIETTHTQTRMSESDYGKSLSLSLHSALRFTDAVSSLRVIGCSFYGSAKRLRRRLMSGVMSCFPLL